MIYHISPEFRGLVFPNDQIEESKIPVDSIIHCTKNDISIQVVNTRINSRIVIFYFSSFFYLIFLFDIRLYNKSDNLKLRGSAETIDFRFCNDAFDSKMNLKISPLTLVLLENVILNSKLVISDC